MMRVRTFLDSRADWYERRYCYFVILEKKRVGAGAVNAAASHANWPSSLFFSGGP